MSRPLAIAQPHASKPQHLPHAVEPWRLAGRPQGCLDTPAGEEIPVRSTVAQFDPLALGREDDAMITRVVPAPQAGKADFASRSRPGDAAATFLRHLPQVSPPSNSCCFSQQQRGPRGGIDLVTMVHLQDLDIVVGPQRPRGLLNKKRQQTDAKAHVAGVDKGDFLCSLPQHRQLRLLQPGGANDQCLLLLGREAGMDKRCLRCREVDGDVTALQSLRHLSGCRDTDVTMSSQRPEIPADQRAVRPEGTSDQTTALRLETDGKKPPPHAPATAEHGNSDFLHYPSLELAWASSGRDNSIEE